MKITGKVTGGSRLRAHSAKMTSSPEWSVDVGFFETARYPPIKTGKDTRKNRDKPRKQEPHPVAFVAAANEFGSDNVPERPFFRLALKSSNERVADIIKAGTDDGTVAMSRRVAETVGSYVADQIQQSIVKLDDPANKASTIKAKGSSNPLIDTATMKNSVTWRSKSGA